MLLSYSQAERSNATCARLFQAITLRLRPNVECTSEGHVIPLFLHHLLTVNHLPSPNPHFFPFPTRDMADQSASARFRALFEAGLQVYEKKTSITLSAHPLAVQIQSCHSVESISAVLQGQARAFTKFRGSDKMIKLIKNTLSILTALSDTATLGDSSGLVSLKALRPVPQL